MLLAALNPVTLDCEGDEAGMSWDSNGGAAAFTRICVTLSPSGVAGAADDDRLSRGEIALRPYRRLDLESAPFSITASRIMKNVIFVL